MLVVSGILGVGVWQWRWFGDGYGNVGIRCWSLDLI
jgi:hypothetical protein